MSNLLKPLPLLALLASALPALAQETAETPTDETPAAEAGAEVPTQGEASPAEAGEIPAEGVAPAGDAEGEGTTDIVPELDMGQPADGASAEPQVGQPYIREEFGDWALRCLRTGTAADPCQLYQLLLDADGNPVAEISVFPLPEGSQAVAGAEVVVPLLTLLTEELTLSVDGSAARRYPFSYCNQAGCVARVGFTNEEVEQFRRGSAGSLSIVPALAPDETVTLMISLTGFTAGYESTREALEAAEAAEQAPAE